ncbi:MAG TPA: hypothetical protein VH396_03730 [Chitinophagaceae bacterium]|jgi:hypothetical protein
MKTTKVLVSGIAGGIVYFIIGGFFYGILLRDFLSNNISAGELKPQDQVVWWAGIASNLILGILVAYILIYVDNISRAGKGATTAMIVGFLMTTSYDLALYALVNLTTLNFVIVDVIITTIMSAAAGAVIVQVSKKIK